MSAPVLLVSAYGADPGIPSEPFIAWTFLVETARLAGARGLDVAVLTNRRSAAALRREQFADPELRFEVLEVGLPRLLRGLEKPRIGMLARVEYLVWNTRARRRVRQLCRSRSVVLAHHVSFATEILPTPIAAAGSDTFRVWGPIGADGVAEVFLIPPRSRASRWEYLVQRARDLLSRTVGRSRARRVDLVLAQSPALERALGDGVRIRVFPNLLLDAPPESAVDDERRASPAAGLSVLSVGHLIPRKRFELAVAALATPELAGATLHLVGRATGVEDYVAAFAERLGVADRVVLHGQIPRGEVLALMRSCSVLLHPAGREGAPGVIGEASSAGIPIVCFAGTGAAAMLRESGTSGVLVEPRRDLAPSELAAAVVAAAGLPRVPGPAWDAARFRGLVHDLITEALDRRRP
ncbi:glycosyltransferase [Salinibacterium soli]|uniref:Glycosyltransferase n=1 Tax=Antiquaquibacter soli TaxID=3064523 RepID=A0ABT9BJ24_9MICO|nr:glycosyltransferase [Protaetiibacter sp. WY-16]MDO7881023.1 glycosyltransferase [Protaetiibacter sp. WY-16]